MKQEKLYYIETYVSVEGEVELFTFKDALDILEHCQLLQPENRYEIKEFED